MPGLRDILDAATPGKVRLCSHPSRFRHCYTDFRCSRVFCGKCGKTIYARLGAGDSNQTMDLCGECRKALHPVLDAFLDELVSR